jgi:peptidoglycan/LPS O-acetylase OafA/YrhL
MQFFNANIFPKALDNFVLGILFSHILSRKDSYTQIIRRSSLLCSIGVGLICLSYLICTGFEFLKFSSGMPNPNFSIMSFELFRYLPAFGTFFLLFCVFLPPDSRVCRFLAFSPLQYLGLISYEWFLFHQPPVRLMADILGNSGGSVSVYAAKTILPFFVSFAFAAALYHYVSKPILDWAKTK